MKTNWKLTTHIVYDAIFDQHRGELVVHGSYTRMDEGRHMTEWGFRDAHGPLIKSERDGDEYRHYIASSRDEPVEECESEVRFDMTKHDGPYPCGFKCGAKLRTKHDRIEVAGWMWFTGKSERTFHACPNCANERAVEIAEMMQRRGLTPLIEVPAHPYPRLVAIPLPEIETPSQITSEKT